MADLPNDLPEISRQRTDSFDTEIENYSAAAPDDGAQDSGLGSAFPLHVTAPQNIRLGATASGHGLSDIQPSSSNTFACNSSALYKEPQLIPTFLFFQPRLPTKEDFARISGPISYDLIAPHSSSDTGPNTKHMVLVLHDPTRPEKSLAEFTKNCLEQPETAYILLRAPRRATREGNGHTWADTGHPDSTFLEASRTIISVILEVLIPKCYFPPRNIILFGCGQGGMVALTVAAAWKKTELGGVISIEGPMLNIIQANGKKAKTPVLIMGNISDGDEQHVRDLFLHVDVAARTGVNDYLPSRDEIGPLNAFFAHRLRREEWTKRAILTLDGGGIRGYGTLLILQNLMRMIEREERRLDEKEKRVNNFTTSSFHPGMYKPRMIPTHRNADASPARESNRSSSSSNSDESASSMDPDAETSRLAATPTAKLPASARFLPCHYFDYCGGTSTGGLIAIMLSRLRMSVDDCLHEYRRLGGKVFGMPHPLALGAVFWHKYSGKKLEKAIEEVMRRHGNVSKFGRNFPLAEDLCRTVVIAFDDSGSADKPYLFRTYGQPQRKKSTLRIRGQKRGVTGIPTRNPGDAQPYDTVQIGRATSAAPTYFPPTKIEKADGTKVRFKDGGFGCNNPSEELYNDAIIKHGGDEQSIGPFLSLGTGEQNISLFAGGGNLRNALANFTAIRRLPVSTRHVTHHMEGYCNRSGAPFFRFDGGTHLGAIKMDDWHPRDLSIKHIFNPGRRKEESGERTLQKIRNATALYLSDENVQRHLKRCAKLLVRRRRLRTRDTSAWERYALASHFICPIRNCDENKHISLESFVNHFLAHSRANGNGNGNGEGDAGGDDNEEEKLQRVIDEARCCWMYNPDFPDIEDGPPTDDRVATGLSVEI